MPEVLSRRSPDPPAAGRTAHNSLLIDARQLADMLQVAVRTIRRWNAQGKIPRPLHIGGSVRWWGEEVRAWIEAGAPDRATWERLRESPHASR